MSKKQTWLDWAREVAADPFSPSRIEPKMLGTMSGQDMRGLNAIAACWQLYANADNAGRRGAIVAIYALLPALSPDARFVARELIAFAMGDWSYVRTTWAEIEKIDRHAPIEGGCDGSEAR